jgi:peptide chain release factor 1
MLVQLAKLEKRFLEIENLLSRAEVISDNNQFRKLSKERSEIEEGVLLFRDLKKCLQEIDDVALMLQDAHGEMAELAREEKTILENRKVELEDKLKFFLLPKDPNDNRNVILEIRAGAGGDEASLFVADLFRMYTRYCERKGWRFDVMSTNENGLGGIKEAIALIEGEAVYRFLKHESGVHRVQRVPVTESQGRVHTSTVTVAILPEADEVEVSVNESDLRVDTYRASGAGGQHVNRTDSAVRLTHIPSGIVVACQDERSQIKNRSRAMKILKSRLLEMAQMEQDKQLAEDRRSQVGRGDRSERIRTYNFPQSRVTDHRVNYTTHAIDTFLEGDISEVIALLQEKANVDLLAKQALGSGDL